MPVPESVTVRRAAPETWSRPTATDPVKVNLRAFERRLPTIFSHISRSTYAGSDRGSQRTSNVRPAFSTAERNMLASSLVYAARSTGS